MTCLYVYVSFKDGEVRTGMSISTFKWSNGEFITLLLYRLSVECTKKNPRDYLVSLWCLQSLLGTEFRRRHFFWWFILSAYDNNLGVSWKGIEQNSKVLTCFMYISGTLPLSILSRLTSCATVDVLLLFWAASGHVLGWQAFQRCSSTKWPQGTLTNHNQRSNTVWYCFLTIQIFIIYFSKLWNPSPSTLSRLPSNWLFTLLLASTSSLVPIVYIDPI